MSGISVIIPVYNREQRVARCVESVLSQSYGDLEIIIVDDGSQDRTYEICNRYALADNRIKLVRQENKGVSQARNAGMALATSAWLTFVDSDDYLAPDCYRRMIEMAEKENSDMLLCDFYENGKYMKQYKGDALDGEEVARLVLKGSMHGACWNKLFRRSVLVDNGISFNSDISFCEDMLFVVQFCLQGVKVSYLGEAFYHYEHNDGEECLTSNVSGKMLTSLQKVVECLQETIPEGCTLKRQKEDLKRMAYKLSFPKQKVKAMYEEVNFDLILKALPNLFGSNINSRLVRYMYF